MSSESASLSTGLIVERPFFMLKPPPEALSRIVALRHRLGIEQSYGADRLHVTLMPLDEIGAIRPDIADDLVAIIGGLDFEPFRLVLGRLQRNMLMVGAGGRAITILRRAIEEALARHGWRVNCDNRPHLSLCYNAPSNVAARIEPIEWMVRDIRLIVSLNGLGRHIDHGTVPLIPRQGELF